MIKKELGVYLRVPGNDQQKTDLVNTLSVVGLTQFGPFRLCSLSTVILGKS